MAAVFKRELKPFVKKFSVVISVIYMYYDSGTSQSPSQNWVSNVLGAAQTKFPYPKR